MKRQYEFAKLYYDWIVKCLTEDEKWEVLAYFVLGCELCVRQHELISINWSQISYPYINNIKVLKVRPNGEFAFYLPKEISEETMNVINQGCDKNREKLFEKHFQWYIKEIIDSCGDSNFNGHVMRMLGATFKLNQFE